MHTIAVTPCMCHFYSALKFLYDYSIIIITIMRYVKQLKKNNSVKSNSDCKSFYHDIFLHLLTLTLSSQRHDCARAHSFLVSLDCGLAEVPKPSRTIPFVDSDKDDCRWQQPSVCDVMWRK